MRRVVKVFGLLVSIIFLLGQIAYAGNPFNTLKNLGSLSRNALKAGTGLAGRIPGTGLAGGAAGAAGRWGLNHIAKPTYNNIIQRPASAVVNQGIKPAAGWVKNNAKEVGAVLGGPVGMAALAAYKNRDNFVRAGKWTARHYEGATGVGFIGLGVTLTALGMPFAGAPLIAGGLTVVGHDIEKSQLSSINRSKPMNEKIKTYKIEKIEKK